MEGAVPQMFGPGPLGVESQLCVGQWVSLKLINVRQTALLLGVGPADSTQATPPGPQPSAAPLGQHFTGALNQLIQTGVGREGGKTGVEDRRDGEERKESPNRVTPLASIDLDFLFYFIGGRTVYLGTL